MAGPTTEVINDDLKALREEVHRVEVSLRDDLHRVEVSLGDQIHQVDNGLASLRAEFELAKWLLGLLLVTMVTGVATGIWMASRISTKLDLLETRVERVLDQTKGR